MTGISRPRIHQITPEDIQNNTKDILESKYWLEMKNHSKYLVLYKVVPTVMSGILFARFPTVDYVTQLWLSLYSRDYL